MTQPRHVEFKSSVCSLCGGTHYGSTECPYRCERCTTNTDPCHLPDCPRNARWAAENAAADARIAADRGKPLAREQIEHHLRECRMNTQPKHTLPRDRLMALCEAALRSLPTEGGLPTDLVQYAQDIIAQDNAARAGRAGWVPTSSELLMAQGIVKASARTVSPLERRTGPVGWVVALEAFGENTYRVYGPQYATRQAAEDDADLPRKRGQKAQVWECHLPADPRPPMPEGCVGGCPPKQVCDHCQWPTSGKDKQSPPQHYSSSTKEK